MNTRTTSFFILVFNILFIGKAVIAKDIYVSPNGNDNNKGTINSPLKTVGLAIKRLRPGDSCILMPGAYHEEILINNLRGTSSQPITIKAEKRGTAYFDGTIKVEADWKLYKNGIYRAKLDQDIWQLFFDGGLMTQARFPDVIWNDDSFWKMKESMRSMSTESYFGKAVDERPSSHDPHNKLADGREEEGVESSVIREGYNTQSLAETAVSMKGAIAVMKLGSWMTWDQFIDEHKKGSDTFTYSTDFSTINEFEKKRVQRWAGNEKFWDSKNRQGKQALYFIEGLACLNQEKEWWYDHKTKYLYFKPPTVNGKPVIGWESKLRGKNMTYALALIKANHVIVDGINFYGTTFMGKSCKNTTVQNVKFEYPAWNKRVLGNLNQAEGTLMNLHEKPGVVTNNKIINCSIRNTDGPALQMLRGTGDVIDNLLIENSDYSCVGQAMAINLRQSYGDIVNRVTIKNSGGSQGVQGGNKTKVTYCYFENVGAFQHDGGGTQFGVFDGAEVAYNWSLYHKKNGFRFDDAGGPPNPPSTNGFMHHNVTVSTRGIITKGDKHQIYNNLILGTDKGLIVLDWAKMSGINKKTITANNIGHIIASRWWGSADRPIPGVAHDNLIVSEVDNVIRDFNNGDFRPQKALKPSSGKTHKGIPNSYMGPYIYGEENYWIPGFQSEKASFPIPYNETITAKRTSSLMWLQAYEVKEHRVYLSTSKRELEKATTKSKAYKGSFKNNIYEPKDLLSGQQYFWRVDAIKDGQVIKGDTWTFTVNYIQ